jgi:peptidoglycan/xylan/chitin deacetylase (PgdA/CDA1 family)
VSARAAGQAAPVGPETTILCYHAVSRDWNGPLAVHPRRLERQLRTMLRRGYAPRTLSQAMTAERPQRTLVVTFDDAYRSVLTQAMPVLAALGVPATVFVTTDLAATGAPVTDAIPIAPDWVGPGEEMRSMTWEELRGVAGDGWEVGSHTCSHPDLTGISAGAAGEELRRSRQDCEEALQRECPSVAYPFGAHDATVVAEAQRAGYRHGVTLGRRLLEPAAAPGPLELPRLGIYRGTGSLEFALATAAPVRRLCFRRGLHASQRQPS